MWRWREFLRWRALKLPLTKVLVEWMTFKETRLSTTLSHFSFSFLCSSSFSFCSLLFGRETLVVCLQSSYYWKKHKGLSHFWKCHQAWITECVPEQCALMVALSEWVSERALKRLRRKTDKRDGQRRGKTCFRLSTGRGVKRGKKTACQ